MVMTQQVRHCSELAICCWTVLHCLHFINERTLYAIARPSIVCLSSVVCNVRAPYSGSSNFWQYFYGIRYLGHPL